MLLRVLHGDAPTAMHYVGKCGLMARTDHPLHGLLSKAVSVPVPAGSVLHFSGANSIIIVGQLFDSTARICLVGHHSSHACAALQH
jgi:hypothetical protein